MSDLHTTLLYAGLRARVLSRAVHVYRSTSGTFAWSDFRPHPDLRSEWLAVAPAGAISDGATGRRVGSVSDLLAQH